MENKIKKYSRLLNEFNEELINQLDFDSFAKEMLCYQIMKGGKKIRPLIVFEVTESLGGKIENSIPFAATVEILHNASLVHDDIQDGDFKRRGEDSLWKKFGINQAINLGDLLFSLSFDALMKTRINEFLKIKLIEKTSKTVSYLANGQIKDLLFENNYNISMDQYFKMIREKTGALFSLSFLSGAILSEKYDLDLINQLSELGFSIGKIFQLRDDIIDIEGQKEGRSVGSDIINGKSSIITLLILQNKTMDEKEKISKIIKNIKTDFSNMSEIMKMIEREKIVLQAKEIYEFEKSKIKTMDILKTNSYLNNFINYLLNWI
jgi:geranylgeranyl diphosphate synthase, type I